MKELLCNECRERVVEEIAGRGVRERSELAYKQAVSLKKKAEELMAALERKVF